MKKLLLVSLCFLVLCMTQVFAQNRTVTGTVTAKDDGLPIPGVTVKIKGTNIGTPTDVNGKFSLSAPANATLVFSFIGYATQEVGVKSAPMRVVLEVSANQTLGEVVITGALGQQLQKKDQSYAAATVNNAELNQGNAINVANGLQGKVSGLNIQTINSGVFENVKINLRGIRSLTGNNNPLLLVDGVQSDINLLSSLNPNDIESTTILKGPAGAAIYGSDARNGAIVVTTKRGTKSGKPVIQVSNSTQFISTSFFPKFQNGFGLGGGGNNRDLGGYTEIENWSWGPAYDGSQKQIGPDYDHLGTAGGAYVDPKFGTLHTQFVPYTGNQERQNFFNTGSTVQNDVSYSEKNFYLSVQDAIVKGIVPDDKNRRTGIRMNTTKEYGRLKLTVNTNYTQQNYNVFDAEGMSDFNTSQGIGLNQGLMNLLFNTAGYVPLSKWKDFKNDPYASYNYYYTDYGLNPYFAIDNWRKSGKKQDLLANLGLDFKVADWMNLTYRVGVTTQNILERRTSQGETPNPFGVSVRNFGPISANVEERSYFQQRLSSELFANFKKQLTEDFRINGILGTSVRQIDERDTRVGAVALTVPDLYNISQRTGELTGTSPGRRSRLFALYGSAGINYKGWANVEVTGRNEQTSVLNTANNTYFYPGVTGSIVLTDAIDAIKNNNTLSYLKLRAGWNKTGNADIAPYQLAATFSQGGGFPYGSTAGYSADNTIYNKFLKPEFINSIEAGFESAWLNNRITVEATAFKNKMTDQIINIGVSSATGYTTAYVNAAAFTSKGAEFDLGLTPLVDLGQVHINFKANATYIETNISSIYPGLDQLLIGGYASGANYAIKDYSAFVIRAADYVRDPNGRVVVNALTGAPTVDPTPKIFGQTAPKWVVGLNPSVKWKGLNVSALFEYKGGHMAYNDLGNAMSWTGVSALSAVNNRQRWVFPNSSINTGTAAAPVYVPNTNVTLNNPETFFTGVGRNAYSTYLTSAASWRFRELSIGYDVPVSIFGGQKVIKALNIQATARNLALWLPKSNQWTDPDFMYSPAAANYGSGSTTGVQTGNTAGISNSTINPPVRTIGGAITVTF
jgi:TonB-linked SusC/RagA family outer membrane protein